MILVLAEPLGCGERRFRVGTQENHDDQDGGAGGRDGGKGGTSSAAAGGSANASAGVGSGGLASGGRLSGLGGEYAGGDSSAGTGGTGGASAGAGGGSPMVPVQGCVVDGGGMCAGSPELILNVPGCEKLELTYGGKSLFVLSTGTRQLFNLKPGAAAPTEIPAALDDGIGQGLPTAFALDLGETNAFVAVGQAVVRVDLQLGGTQLLIREREPIVDVAEMGGFVKYVRGAAVLNMLATSNGAVASEVTSEVDGSKPSAVAAAGTVAWANLGSASVKVWGGAEARTVAPSQGNLVLGHRALQADYGHVFWMNFGLKRANVLLPDEMRDVLASANGDLVAFTLGFQRATDVPASQAYVATSVGTIEVGAIAADSTADPAETTVLARDMGVVTAVEVDAGRVFVATADCNLTTFPRPTPPP